MVMTITAPANRPNTAVRWMKAAERAVAEGVRVMQLPTCGVWVASSSSDAATAYVVTTDDCECHAGAHGDPVCKHRAALRLHLGLMTLPEPVAAPVVMPARMCTDCLDTGFARMRVGHGLNDWVAVPCSCPAGRCAA